MDLFHNSCCSYANFHSYRSDMIFWNLRLLAAKMPWVKAISVQRNVNTTFKFIHFYYNILYAIEKLWFHSVSFHFIEKLPCKRFLPIFSYFHQDITLNLKDVVPKTFTMFWLPKVFLRKTVVKQVWTTKIVPPFALYYYN